MPITLTSFLSRTQVNTRIQIELPAHISDNIASLYYRSRQQEIDHKLDQAIHAYIAIVEARSDQKRITLLPSNIDFNVDTHAFTLRNLLGRHTLSNGDNAFLEVEVTAFLTLKTKSLQKKKRFFLFFRIWQKGFGTGSCHA